MLVAKDIRRNYGELQVLKGIDLEIKSGEVVAIVGPSGAGKTTLLQILGTLDKADAGQVLLNGTELNGLPDKELVKIRNAQLGFVFQFHNLMAELTALENVCLPAWIGQKDEKETEQKARNLLQRLGLGERIEHLPSEMSGGEQQRVAVARALINSPTIIFADEPTGNLDTQNADELHQLFFQIRDEFNCAFVLVTHNKELANLADRTIRMKDGRIEEI
ncbi:ABC transporter ATP-binding protein [Marinilongibacter aquaticus]|uniref:ABC transporter ATP-binding protein n=1 Tax=Marinilongibacter aquaticus TaxID=2975157 RepID=UPI0021BD33C3|nr:ABC transporter ATP-binding protein [Marinilongibacter aquaticus]UBM59381.1 ABC transporter ATP-binding protein [Marinilongibacter aquaticus]